MDAYSDVSLWIDSLPKTYAPIPSSSAFSNPKNNKRRRHQGQEPSPPMSEFSHRQNDSHHDTQHDGQHHEATPVTPTRKRQRLSRPDLSRPTDLDTTPRSYQDVADLSAASSTTSRSTNRSRSSSPLKKQLMQLRVDDHGIEFRSMPQDFDLESSSPISAAEDLINTLDDVGRAIEILPDEYRTKLLPPSSKRQRAWKLSFKSPDHADTLPGRIPTPEEVALIQQAAHMCQSDGHEESSWNAEVHHQLLKAIFRRPGSVEPCDKFNFTLATTARPHRSWLPPSSASKAVDFCVYAQYQEDEYHSEIAQLCTRTPTLSVNHTDFQPLQRRPMVLSIETKKLGAGIDAAQLQMGVWHSTQWSFLRAAVISTLRAVAKNKNKNNHNDRTTQPDEEAAESAAADDIMSQLPFIPGVITWGHQWQFLVSTREGNKTAVYWRQRPFGGTESLQEIYQLVAGLRELAAWARDVYLPWYNRHVLGILSDGN